MNTLHPVIKFRRVNPDAPMPQKAHQSDAAYDLCAMEDVTLMPGEWKMIGSGIATAIPAGYCGKVYPRSGLGCKGLVLKNQTGIIDSAYRGEIKIPLMNNNPTHVWYYGPSDDQKKIIHDMLGEYGDMLARLVDDAKRPVLIENDDGAIHVHKGDRVAQLCIELVPDTELVEVEELPDSDRGEDGFGSSGVSSITGGDRL